MQPTNSAPVMILVKVWFERSPERFEARIAHGAHHHRRQKHEHDRQADNSSGRGFFLFVEMNDEAASATPPGPPPTEWGSRENPCRAAAGHRGEAVEPRQAERAAEQINRGDEPADLPVFAEHVRSTTRWTRNAGATPKEIRSASESNSRPNGLSTPPMRATRPSNKSKMHASRMNAEREFDLAEIIADPRVGLDNFGQRHETAEQIARRQQVRQKINLQLFRIVGRRFLEIGSFISSQSSAITVSPPTTRSPSLTLILARIGR
jgi:hypothetical protein